ncbi:MAG TPA: hypothetical protein VKY74_22165 [Chloroflexia bacterium]|nr:hypothetical protein [Chloroflexia bacterium]
MKSTSSILRMLGILAILGLLLGAPGASRAQSGSQTFPQTGKTVSGLFLTYWQTHGALAQQGYPISDEMQEVSDLNGQTYTVQYFERAVFEKHPENQPPYDVLLSQLGTFRYKEKYPTGAPDQQPSTDNPRVFPQTNHTLGGVFRTYWETHGGLAQQGFPISDEFTEVSDLNGQSYKVQYFERAVFELHPENQPPYNVLLSQLGTFQYRKKYLNPTATPAPAATSTPVASGCDAPASKDATVTPACGSVGTIFRIHITGFTPNEHISFWLTAPNGQVLGTPRPLNVGSHNGQLDDSLNSSILPSLMANPLGIWAITYQGEQSSHQSVAFFKITSTATPVPNAGCDVSGSRDGSATPTSGRPGDTLIVTARGFTPGEAVSFWFTLPNGQVFGTARPIGNGVNPDGTVGPIPFQIPAAFSAAGRYALTFQGASSQHQAIVLFCVTP